MSGSTGSYSPSQANNISQLSMIQELYSLTNIEWDKSETGTLKEFASKFPTPHIATIEQGQFMNIGSSKHVHPNIHTEVLFHSVKTCQKVFAQGVKVKDRKVTITSQNLTIPLTYQGWFEVLSEDGKSVKPFETVRDLARRFPNKCLVRSSVKGYITNERGELTLSRSRLINAGEVLTLLGDLTVPSPKGKGKSKLLRCFDQNGAGVYLNFDSKGAFSPIAERDNISGCHTLTDLVTRFRLPIMVRLVYGLTPTGSKVKFTGCFRLVSTETDTVAFIMPLDMSQKNVTSFNYKGQLKATPCS